MLVTQIEKLEDVPENVRGAYIKNPKGSGYILDSLDETTHPLAIKKNELLGKEATRNATITQLTTERDQAIRERDAARTNTVPEGKALVDKEIAELGETAKAANLAKDQIPVITKEHSEWKTERETIAKNEVLSRAAKSIGIAEGEPMKAFLGLPTIQGLSFDSEKIKLEKGGEEEKFYIVETDSSGVKSKKPFTKEFVETDASIKPFLPAIFATEQPGNKVSFMKQTSVKQGQPVGNPADALLSRKYAHVTAEKESGK